ncbi:MAG: sulfatase-like hydrolase/transferase [Verrucomicrobia subdivision 3 bacterium]|nr:sulfatase-like hydrolase/transferase [Limisphaerales bacterium]
MRKLLLSLCALLLLAGSTMAAKRPNFVFLVSEDNSIHYLKLYGYGATTPNIEALAKDGLTFNHAFSNSPVCSVARSTLATSLLAPRAGFQYHRKSAMANLPKGYHPWSAMLRKAGYYAANNSKTDYNFVNNMKELWNESSRNASWRKRAKGQPFFYMQSFGQSHESSLHFSQQVFENEKTKHDPAKVKLAPYHPDTPLFRYTHARYLDRIQTIDSQLGNVVKQLAADGLLEDTFIFYFGDHGGVLPRGKGYAYESGLHVPLVVRIPKNFAHLADHPRGTRTDGFVSFIDFGPTVLNLAGLQPHKLTDGRAFLGKNVSAKALAARDEAFGYADRFDEKYDLVRTLRKGKYTYIRNLQGFYPDALQNNYRYKMLAFTEWRELAKAGKLNEAQLQFHQRRPAEQLFDVEADPHEVNNLAADPKHAAVLADLRGRLQKKLRDIHDLSFFPENFMVQNALKDGVGFGAFNHKEINRLADIADLALLPFAEARKPLAAALKAKPPMELYWACTTASVIGEEARPLVPLVKKLLTHENLMVRMRAAEFLGSLQASDPMPTLLGVLNTARTEQELMLTFNAAVYLRDYKGYPFDHSKLDLKFKGGEIVRRTSYLEGNPRRPPRKKPKK